MASNVRRQQFDTFRRHAGFWWAVGIAVAVLLAGAAQRLEDQPWGPAVKGGPRPTFGDLHPDIVTRLTFLALLLGFLEAVRQVYRRRQWHIDGVRNGPLVEICHTLVLTTSRLTGLPVEDLGVSVFVPRTDWWSLSKRKSLFRVHKFRITGPVASNVDWTVGKGAVGRCWATTRYAHVDWAKIFGRVGSPPVTEAAWRRLSAADRSSFTRDEFNQVLGKYSEVLAVPAVEPQGALLRAIVSVDVSARSSHLGPVPKLEDARVLDAVEEAARRVVSTGTR